MNSGIVYNLDDHGTAKVCHLPLEKVRIKVIIVDISARVTLIQTYRNPRDEPTNRCKYRFPVPAGAAICAFSMQTSDGRTVTGAAKEKNFAGEEFERAIRAGNFAGKVDYITDDIFTISIGSLLAQATVEIKLVYVMTLMNDDDSDAVRFQLPMTIAERYGTPPDGLAEALAADSSTRVKITVHCQTSGDLKEIISLSHPDSITENRYPTHLGRPSRRRSTIYFQLQTFLDQDFVLIIRAQGLDGPRCFAELEQDPCGGSTNTLAMQLSIVPKFNFPQIKGQEYLFVIDRSGSMEGEAIETAKRTLAILLRMLPVEGSHFNIFSFGDTVSGLWNQSRLYDQSTLDLATIHVDAIGANYGGTEIRRALEHVVGSCSAHMPTAMFVLTDGRTHDIDETCSVIRGAVDHSLSHAPLRVFTLGMGRFVSSALCEGMARAGNGVCLFALHTEEIVGKCARLFRAGRTPFVEDVEIDWGISSDHMNPRTPSVGFVNQFSNSRTVEIRSTPAIQQAPTHIGGIHAGTRLNVFAIMSLRTAIIPKTVTIRGRVERGGGAFELTVPIKGVQLRGAESGLPLIHTLAAWRLIQEHEEKRAPLPQALTIASDDEIRKAVIVRLGERYQLVSQYTSFVAVDSGQDNRGRPHARELGPSPPRTRSPSPSMAFGSTTWNYDTQANSLPQGGFRASVLNFVSGLFGFGVPAASSNLVPGAWPDSSVGSSPSSEDNIAADDEDVGYKSTHTFSTLSSLEGSDSWSDWSPPSSPSLVPEEEEHGSSPQLVPRRLAPEGDLLLLPPLAEPILPPPPPPLKLEVTQLIRLQLFDGSFPLDGLRNIVGNAAVDEVNNLQVDDKVWATALSVAFIIKHVGEQKALLDDLVLKAMEFLKYVTVGVEVQDIVNAAHLHIT